MPASETLPDYKFEILHEQVADVDLYDSQTHTKVSESIYRLIKDSKKGISIGLEGSWGAGKSTVVNLLSKKLSSDYDREFLFFNFDSWAHEGDPLRTIFLESLIQKIDPSSENDKLRTLMERRKTTVSTTRILSGSGQWLSAAALLVPIGTTLLSATQFDDVVFPFSPIADLSSPNWTFIFGVFFSFFWALVLLTLKIIPNRKNNEEGASGVKIFNSNISEKKHTQELTQDGDRTSVEFEKLFSKIITIAFEDLKYHKVIIVIDNLDRTEPEKAKAIWDTLQTFLQHNNSYDQDSLSWIDKLWFIIPFDRSALNNIWQNGNNEKTEITLSYIEKCLQVTAEVPTPIISTWITYFSHCVESSLVGWPESDKKQVVNTFQQYVGSLEISPTPRQMRVLTNNIGMLGLMWGGQVSAEALCLFALYKNDITTNKLRKELISNPGLPKGYTSQISNIIHLKQEISGLIFGVDKELGMQILITEEILDAINTGHGAILDGLENTYGEVFWIAWDSFKNKGQPLITSMHEENYRINYTLAFYGLHMRKKKIKSYLDSLNQIWSESIPSWNFENKDYIHPIQQLVKMSENRTADYWMVTAAEYHLDLLIGKVGTKSFSENELGNLRNYINYLGEAKFKEKKHSHLDSTNWAEWQKHCKKLNITFDFVLPKD